MVGLGILVPSWRVERILGVLALLVGVVAAATATAQLNNYIRERTEAARPYLVVDYRFH